MKTEIRFYIAVFFRRIHYFLIVFLIVAAAALTLARVLPPEFVARSTLLLESSQIPAALAAPTVNTGAIEELQIVQQRLMTRNNLLEVARELNVFDNMAEMTTDQIVEEMRQSTIIRRVTGRSQATLMLLEFRSDRGAVAANVLSRYVTIILQANVETRTGRAGDTLAFFELEVERLGQELAEKSAEIVIFQNENAGALPNTLGFRLNQQTVLQQRLSTVEREIANLTEQRRRLVEIFNATGSVGTANTVPLTPEQIALATLQDDLRRALAIYSTENPNVKLIQARIAQQEIVVAEQIPTNPNPNQAPLTALDVNLADIDARLDLSGTERLQIIDQLAELVESIEKTAEIAIVLAALNREYSSIQGRYDTTVGRQSAAAAAERIELLSKGRRISVLSPPTVPQAPDSPDRLLIGGGGILLGMALGLFAVFLAEFLDSSIRRPSEIVRQMGVTPLATVPYVHTPIEMVMRRAMLLGIFTLVLIGVPASLFAVHTYVMPLDLLYDAVAKTIADII